MGTKAMISDTSLYKAGFARPTNQSYQGWLKPECRTKSTHPAQIQHRKWNITESLGPYLMTVSHALLGQILHSETFLTALVECVNFSDTDPQ